MRLITPLGKGGMIMKRLMASSFVAILSFALKLMPTFLELAVDVADTAGGSRRIGDRQNR